MKKVLALAVAVVMVVGLVGVLALDYNVPEYANQTTSTWTITDIFASDSAEVTMINEEGDLVIHITEDTIVYFEDFVPMSDVEEGEEAQMTQMVREVLFGRTLAEVLDGRRMTVTYGPVAWSMPGQTTPISVKVLFETAVALPAIEIETGEGYENIMTLPGDISNIDWDDYVWIPELNGEIVVNNVIIDAASPFNYSDVGGPNVVMVPLRAVAEALGYDVSWSEETQSIMLGVGIHVFIGRNEAYRGRMAPIELSLSPFIRDNLTFVPLDFVRNVLAQNVWVFEGQVVIDSEYQMM
ncbi:MAG: copper amine oxidase N-terminal domain-containing protein [Oscillospiraceae bacterium]|nr:copper amine oxidase N-terminal domain-containing protein [Oscillospiraceae bacterium]